MCAATVVIPHRSLTPSELMAVRQQLVSPKVELSGMISGWQSTVQKLIISWREGHRRALWDRPRS